MLFNKPQPSHVKVGSILVLDADKNFVNVAGVTLSLRRGSKIKVIAINDSGFQFEGKEGEIFDDAGNAYGSIVHGEFDLSQGDFDFVKENNGEFLGKGVAAMEDMLFSVTSELNDNPHKPKMGKPTDIIIHNPKEDIASKKRAFIDPDPTDWLGFLSKIGYGNLSKFLDDNPGIYGEGTMQILDHHDENELLGWLNKAGYSGYTADQLYEGEVPSEELKFAIEAHYPNLGNFLEDNDWVYDRYIAGYARFFPEEAKQFNIVASKKTANDEDLIPEHLLYFDVPLQHPNELVQGVHSKYGWAIAGQLKNIIGGGSVEDQNVNALQYIAEYLLDQVQNNGPFANDAGELLDFFEEYSKASGANFIEASKKTAGDGLTVLKYENSDDYHDPDQMNESVPTPIVDEIDPMPVDDAMVDDALASKKTIANLDQEVVDLVYNMVVGGEHGGEVTPETMKSLLGREIPENEWNEIVAYEEELFEEMNEEGDADDNDLYDKAFNVLMNEIRDFPSPKQTEYRNKLFALNPEDLSKKYNIPVKYIKYALDSYKRTNTDNYFPDDIRESAKKVQAYFQPGDLIKKIQDVDDKPKAVKKVYFDHASNTHMYEVETLGKITDAEIEQYTKVGKDETPSIWQPGKNKRDDVSKHGYEGEMQPEKLDKLPRKKAASKKTASINIDLSEYGISETDLDDFVGEVSEKAALKLGKDEQNIFYFLSDEISNWDPESVYEFYENGVADAIKWVMNSYTEASKKQAGDYDYEETQDDLPPDTDDAKYRFVAKTSDGKVHKSEWFDEYPYDEFSDWVGELATEYDAYNPETKRITKPDVFEYRFIQSSEEDPETTPEEIQDGVTGRPEGE